ncbi:sugar phosphate isomerase/epimerase family protein [Actomonas aquatica]|uniref:Sugar phosphate isomerase/epimerase n=1 Tax=Actomonas aquatica TaxID=2866162 RepID=A0ABZ1C6Q5_9BACT|nr:sugar phosphate isomerase/epimerase [Opitutus sp. WL0086]WRQ87022.1 sugar phosphate isomerase/epimerase [Opitutus sp. WL0086]
MAKPRTSLQLWSVRQHTQQDFAGTVAAVAKMGYQGVETAGFGNLEPADAAKAIADAGLVVSGMHLNIRLFRADFNKVVDEALLCGATDLIVPSWPAAHYRSAAACRQIGAELNELGARLRPLGFKLHFHNHDWEMKEVEGRRVFDWILDEASPANLGCQADVYWVHKGGKDPVEFIREQGRRISLLHVKDEKEIGSGPVDFAPIFAATAEIGAVQWNVIEVEKYNHDPLESVRLSLEQLKTWGQA